MTQRRTFVARRRTFAVLVRDAAAAPTQTPAHTNAQQSGKDWLHGRSLGSRRQSTPKHALAPTMATGFVIHYARQTESYTHDVT